MALHKRPLLERGFFAALPDPAAVVVVDEGSGRVYGVRLELEGTEADWVRIQEMGLFGCSPDVLGPIFGGAFRPELPFEFTLALLPEHVLTIAVIAESAEHAPEVLAEAPGDSPLRDPHSWRLYSVVQPHSAKVKWGLTTTWFEENLS